MSKKNKIMKAYFYVPEKFENIHIFSSVLFKNFDHNWPVHKTILKEIKSEQFEHLYKINNDLYQTFSTIEIAKQFKVSFVSHNKTVYSTIGIGPKILISTVGARRLLYTNPIPFYFLPTGIMYSGQVLQRLDDILNTLNIPVQVSGVIWKVGNIEIEPCPLLERQFHTVEEKYNLCIDIWEKKQPYQKHFTYTHIKMGNASNLHKIEFHYQKETRLYLYINDRSKYFKHFYRCKNLTRGCLFQFDRKERLEKHELNCITPKEAQENPTIKQKGFGQKDHILQPILDLGYIKKYPENSNFIFFDIECCLDSRDERFGKTVVTHIHKLLSIGANSYINKKHTQKIWVVKDSSIESQIRICHDFLIFCMNEQKRMIVDKSVKAAHKKICDLLKTENTKVLQMYELYEMQYSLKSYLDLCVFGYNSSRYDLNVIFEHIIKCYDELGGNSADVHIIKKGTRYFSLNLNDIHFKDLLNFTCPMSLDEYLKTWTDNHKKLIYPYEHFSSIEQIRECKNFPPIEAFYSSLKLSCVSESEYQSSKLEYERRQNLDSNDINHWSSMECYLKHYNLSDVYPASKAMLNQFNVFEQHFGFSPMQTFGLPSFAKLSMYKLYNIKSPKIFTFPNNSDATQVFRDGMIAGLCNVFKRHCTLLDEPAAYAAKFNIEGMFYI